MDKEKLKEDYENACNAYLKAFCEKHDYWYAGIEAWVGKMFDVISNMAKTANVRDA